MTHSPSQPVSFEEKSRKLLDLSVVTRLCERITVCVCCVESAVHAAHTLVKPSPRSLKRHSVGTCGSLLQRREISREGQNLVSFGLCAKGCDAMRILRIAAFRRKWHTLALRVVHLQRRHSLYNAVRTFLESWHISTPHTEHPLVQDAEQGRERGEQQRQHAPQAQADAPRAG